MAKLTLLKLTKTKGISLLLVLLFLLFGFFFRIASDIQPKVEYKVEDRYLTSKPSPFRPLTSEEEQQEWGKEYRIAAHFASELDLYRALSTLKRALILLPPHSPRKMQLQYQMLYCYYLGKQYGSLIDAFEKSDLAKADPSFVPYQDLLIMLFDSYRILHKEREKEHILEVMQFHFPLLTQKLLTSSAFLEGDLPYIQQKAELKDFLSLYEREKKSSPKAQLFNAFLPGAGYFYLGQTRTAVTALFMNGLFITASIEFFRKGFIAAALITASFEAGWYFGGLYGAAEGAKLYNERLFEKHAETLLQQEKLFPICLLHYGF